MFLKDNLRTFLRVKSIYPSLLNKIQSKVKQLFHHLKTIVCLLFNCCICQQNLCRLMQDISWILFGTLSPSPWMFLLWMMDLRMTVVASHNLMPLDVNFTDDCWRPIIWFHWTLFCYICFTNLTSWMVMATCSNDALKCYVINALYRFTVKELFTCRRFLDWIVIDCITEVIGDLWYICCTYNMLREDHTCTLKTSCFFYKDRERQCLATRIQSTCRQSKYLTRAQNFF